MKLTAKHTVRAAYIGYLTQAITINFAPLLFVTFEETYEISMGKISLLIALSFLTQLTTDAVVAKLSNRLNPRITAIAAHLCAVLGMTGFAWLPELLPSPFVGLAISVMIAAVGGGIVEVIISPIVEACPTEEKSSAMSLLHSFYSWGLAAVVLLSTLFFKAVGIGHWRILACLWALIPAAGAIAFAFVPIYSLDALSASEEEEHTSHSLLRNRLFWIFFVIMFCAGASEMAMIQWASAFAETDLGIPKAIGDLLGPCAFALLMGGVRTFYGRSGGRISLSRFILLSSVLCTVSYLIAALSPLPLISLIGCALCGLAVGIMWPGTYSLASARIPFGGVRMFALLAMAGDIGCLAGPTAAGWIAECFGNNLRVSFLFSSIFPLLILLLVGLGLKNSIKKSK